PRLLPRRRAGRRLLPQGARVERATGQAAARTVRTRGRTRARQRGGRAHRAARARPSAVAATVRDRRRGLRGLGTGARAQPAVEVGPGLGAAARDARPRRGAAPRSAARGALRARRVRLLLARALPPAPDRASGGRAYPAEPGLDVSRSP